MLNKKYNLVDISRNLNPCKWIRVMEIKKLVLGMLSHKEIGSTE